MCAGLVSTLETAISDLLSFIIDFGKITVLYVPESL